MRIEDPTEEHAEEHMEPCVMSLGTPSKRWRWRSVAIAADRGSDVAECTDVHPQDGNEGLADDAAQPEVIGDWEVEDFWDSPRLPEEWQPLEYELLEYANKLPPGFADRVGSELEAQTHTVSQLRARTAQLLQRELAATSTQERFVSDMVPPSPEPADMRVRVTATPAAASAGTTPSKKSIGSAAAAAEAKRRGQLAESAKQLEQKARQVRRSAERELAALSARIRAAEEQQRQLSKEAAEDAVDRKRLWEAEAELLRLRCRLQQLDAARRHAERRATQREDEDRQLDTDVAYLRAEIRSYLARQPEYESLEQREEELRRRLRIVKMQLRTQHRSGSTVPVVGRSAEGQVAASTAAVVVDTTATEASVNSGSFDGQISHKGRKSTLLVRHPLVATSSKCSKMPQDLLSTSTRRRSNAAAAQGGA